MAATTPRKKAAPRKSATAPSVNRDEFTFVTEAGDTIVLPSFATIKPGTIRKARKAEDQLGQLFTIFEVMADEETLEILDDLEQEEYAEVFKEWAEASKVSLGESSTS